MTGVSVTSMICPERFVGHVADINDDTETIHLTNYLSAKLADAMPLAGLIVGRIRQVIVRSVRERNVANAASVKVPQILKVAIDRRAVLHTHRQGYQAFLKLLTYIRNRGCDRKLLRRSGHKPFDEVDQLLCRLLRSSFFFEFGRCVDRHERCVEAALDGTRVVEISAGGGL